ncbi:MAG: hypothetical protein K8S22_15695 [Betaproteobacteria bacterium]|nr:hypothetical protein [Betaproteobacteria bacterium]
MIAWAFRESCVHIGNQARPCGRQIAVVILAPSDKAGSTKKKPASWEDLFFPEIHAVPGS